MFVLGFGYRFGGHFYDDLLKLQEHETFTFKFQWDGRNGVPRRIRLRGRARLGNVLLPLSIFVCLTAEYLTQLILEFDRKLLTQCVLALQRWLSVVPI